jgi:hypothetical protein
VISVIYRYKITGGKEERIRRIKENKEVDYRYDNKAFMSQCVMRYIMIVYVYVLQLTFPCLKSHREALVTFWLNGVEGK